MHPAPRGRTGAAREPAEGGSGRFEGPKSSASPCQLLARRFSCVKTCWSTSRTRCGRPCRTAFVCIVLAQDLSTLPVSERNLLAQHLGCSHVWPWESSSEPPDVSSFAAPGLVRTVRRLLMLILLQTTCFLSYPGPADARSRYPPLSPWEGPVTGLFALVPTGLPVQVLEPTSVLWKRRKSITDPKPRLQSELQHFQEQRIVLELPVCNQQGMAILMKCPASKLQMVPQASCRQRTGCPCGPGTASPKYAAARARGAC